MAPASTAKIEIDREDTGGTFTNYDTLKGTVTLSVTGSISLNFIQVKLEGVSRSHLMIPKFNKKGKREKDKEIQDLHRVLYDTVMVFPPKNIRDVSNAKEFTLTPGQYEYPFEFKIPLESACVKMLGITNKILFNTKNFNVMFNADDPHGHVKLGLTLVNNQIQPVDPQGQPPHSQQYHVVSQLPPSLSGMDDMASVKYFVKVTCKRSLIFSMNLRAFDPFIFLPLDMDSHNRPIIPGRTYEEYREVYVRKLTVFKEKLPEIVGVRMNSKKSSRQSSQTNTVSTSPTQYSSKKPSFLQRVFGASQYPQDMPSSHEQQRGRKYNQEFGVEAKDVPFAFEARFRQPAFLIPNKSPSFRLYILSHYSPSRYTLAEYGKPDESNGLGVIYLQSLLISIVSETIASVVENVSEPELHKSIREEVIPVCHNSYLNVKFDLKNAKMLLSLTASSTTASQDASPRYEIEIPRKFFANSVLPDFMAPSFKTCNITRRYHLRLSAGFSAEKIEHHNDSSNVIKTVDLEYQNIKVLSGLFLSALNSKNNSRTNSQLSIGQTKANMNLSDNGNGNHSPPPELPRRPSMVKGESPVGGASDTLFYDVSDGAGGDLPTYSDVIREQSLQNELEHMEARRRYQQHEQYYNQLE